MSEFVFPNDQPVVLLDSEKAFEALTNEEKLYAHYLSRAAWYGGLIVLIQTSVESPLIYTLLHKIYKQQSLKELHQVAIEGCDLTDEDFQALLVYSSGIFTNMGNYRGFGDSKFIPNLPKEKLEKLIKSSSASKSEPDVINFLWEKCSEKMYSLKDQEKHLGFADKGTTTYFSKTCRQEDADLLSKFFKEKGMEAYNTRTFKTVNENGEKVYEIRLASVVSTEDDEEKSLIGMCQVDGMKFIVTRGDYSRLLAYAITYLQKAKEHAANENERQMLNNYIKSFETGSLEAHKDGSRFWIKDKGPVIETYIGFIESYRDPAGMRGEFEGFVAMVNKSMSAKFAELVNSAEKFLPRLPWPDTYEKDKFLRPDFTSLDVLTFAGSGIPAGICIPNYNDIRQNEGFKNVSLGNVIPASYKESTPNYLNKTDSELLNKHRVGAFEVTVGLHELLGHGSGKLFHKNKDATLNFNAETTLHTETNEKITSWYEEGETFESKFMSIHSAYEECRAECVGLYLAVEHDVLKIFGYEGGEADDVLYVAWLSLVHRGLEGLQMYDPSTETWLQAHCQARFVIMQVLLEAGQKFVTLKQVEGSDGQPDLLLSMDRSKITTVGYPAIGKFLQKLQVFKSTADVAKGKAMFERYSAVTAERPYPFLKYRDVIMARKKPRKMFVQPNTFIDDGKVELRNYDASHEGMIQSWIERFSENELYDILKEEWNKDHDKFECK
ncbi:dipeptidyl peptidase 3 [Tachypleus tridentatus]|uniref:dipeptidyl peptidase 3 n=1 Tax=Tachypleus tridentatus TaxID=6853 RepID=UPI003FD30AA0